MTLNVTCIDMLVGESKLPIRLPGDKAATEGVPHRCQLMLSTNKFPALPEDPEEKERMLSKLYVIQFEYQFDKDDPKGNEYLQSLRDDAFRDELFTLMVICARQEFNRDVAERTMDLGATQRALSKWTTSSTQAFVGQCVLACEEGQSWVGAKELERVYQWWCSLTGRQVEKGWERKLTALLGKTKVNSTEGGGVVLCSGIQPGWVGCRGTRCWRCRRR